MAAASLNQHGSRNVNPSCGCRVRTAKQIIRNFGPILALAKEKQPTMRLKFIGILWLSLCVSAFGQSVRPEDGFYKVKYSWEYDEVKWSFSVGIPENIYDFYRERTHYNDDLMHYVLSDYDRDYIREIVKSFRTGGEEWGLSDLDNVFNVVSFVQSLQYVSDETSRGEDEYVRYPLETLVDGIGDCEDMVILTAAILHEMGYSVLLVMLPEHLALAVKYDKDFPGTYYDYDGDRYYYLEMTGQGWDLGQIPLQYKNQEATLLPLVNRPVVRLLKGGYHYDSYTSNMTSVIFHLECDVENIGPGPTQGLFVQVLVKPDAQANVAYAQKVFQLQELPEAGSATFQMTLSVPRPAQGILEFRLGGQNFKADHLIIDDVNLE